MSRPGRWPAVALAALVAAASGCKDPVSGGSMFEGSVLVGDQLRNFIFFAPELGDDNALMPLVLVFHGGGSSAGGMERISGLEPFGRRDGFAVAYLDALFDTWAHGCDCNISDSLGVDDVAFTLTLIDSLAGAFPIDRGRVYAAGLSQGGLFVQRLACEASDRFAAVATIVATMSAPLAARCAPTSPLPVMIAMGTLDPVIPYDGGGQGNFAVLGAKETAERWVGWNGCAAVPDTLMEPDILDDGTITRRERWSGCQGGAEVLLYTIEGGVHQWEVSGDRTTASLLVDFFLPKRRG